MQRSARYPCRVSTLEGHQPASITDWGTAVGRNDSGAGPAVAVPSPSWSIRCRCPGGLRSGGLLVVRRRIRRRVDDLHAIANGLLEDDPPSAFSPRRMRVCCENLSKSSSGVHAADAEVGLASAPRRPRPIPRLPSGARPPIADPRRTCSSWSSCLEHHVGQRQPQPRSSLVLARLTFLSKTAKVNAELTRRASSDFDLRSCSAPWLAGSRSPCPRPPWPGRSSCGA